MANLTFPSNPTNGQKVTVNDKVFVYNSTTGRWTASRLQILGNLTDDFTVEAPSLGVSLSTVSLDTVGANVYITYTVDQDVKASITTSGIANSDLATISLSQSNNTITITAGTLAFSNGQINLVVTNGRTSNTAVIDVSASYGFDWSLATEQSRIQGNDLTTDDIFGACDIDGDVAVGGAAGHLHSGLENAGAVYVFTTDGSTWTQQQKLVASDAEAFADMGSVVRISGNTVIASAAFKDESVSDTGAVYVFTTDGSTWSQQQKLTASDGATFDIFGQDVGIDGDIIVVGSPDTGTGGGAYVYTRSGSTWTQRQKLVSSDVQSGDNFGYSVSVSGNTIVVGAKDEDTGTSSAGSIYVYVTSDGGSTWTEQQIIRNPAPASFDEYGISVAISGDTIAVGAPYDDDGASASGSVYIFTRSGTTWTQQAKIQPNDVLSSQHFGKKVDLEDDQLIVGTNLESAYVFTRDGTTWTQQIKLEASNKGSGDNFGDYLGISGKYAIVGARNEDTGASNAGSAYIFVAG